MVRPTSSDLPPYMKRDNVQGGFRVVNPIEGNSKRFSKEAEAEARAAAADVLEWVAIARAKKGTLSRRTIGGIIDQWMLDDLPFRKWSLGTSGNELARVGRFKREHGKRMIADTGRLFLANWLKSFVDTGGNWSKWRKTLVMIYAFAISLEVIDYNEADAMPKRPVNDAKVRKELDMAQFLAIQKQAPPWLALAMDIALLTGQGSNEVRGLRRADLVDKDRAMPGTTAFKSHLRVVRKKSKKSKHAFINIPITPALIALYWRSMQLGTTSPFMVCHREIRIKRVDRDKKAGFAYINRDYISRQFKEALLASGQFGHLTKEEHPVFHEIRGLAARLREELGDAPAEVSKLLAHGDEDVTKAYTKAGLDPTKLREHHFVSVTLPFSLEELVSKGLSIAERNPGEVAFYAGQIERETIGPKGPNVG